MYVFMRTVERKFMNRLPSFLAMLSSRVLLLLLFNFDLAMPYQTSIHPRGCPFLAAIPFDCLSFTKDACGDLSLYK